MLEFRRRRRKGDETLKQQNESSGDEKLGHGIVSLHHELSLRNCPIPPLSASSSSPSSYSSLFLSLPQSQRDELFFFFLSLSVCLSVSLSEGDELFSSLSVSLSFEVRSFFFSLSKRGASSYSLLGSYAHTDKAEELFFFILCLSVPLIHGEGLFFFILCLSLSLYLSQVKELFCFFLRLSPSLSSPENLGEELASEERERKATK